MASALPIDRPFAAFLFDMDGTLIDSIASANRAWSNWAAGHGLDVDAVLATMHGVRAIETIRRWGPKLDAEAEFAALMQAEMDDVDDIVALNGAAAFLAALPVERWALVTSAPRALAEKRLAAAGLATPALIVSAEDVEHGKPAPDCFLLAAAHLGVDPRECLIFEDAPAGIAAAEASGAAVVVVGATHKTPMRTPHPVIPGYDDLTVMVGDDNRLTLAARHMSEAPAQP